MRTARGGRLRRATRARPWPDSSWAGTWAVRSVSTLSEIGRGSPTGRPRAVGQAQNLLVRVLTSFVEFHRALTKFNEALIKPYHGLIEILL